MASTLCEWCDKPGESICYEGRMIIFQIFGTTRVFSHGCYEYYSYIMQNKTPEELREIVEQYRYMILEEKREEKKCTKKRKRTERIVAANSFEKSKKLKELSVVSEHPEVGMVVKVRFIEGFYFGIITKIHKDNIHFDITFSDLEIREKYSFINDKNDIEIISYPCINDSNKNIDVRFKFNDKRYKMWKGTIISQIDNIAFVRFNDNSNWIVLIKYGRYGIGIGKEINC